MVAYDSKCSIIIEGIDARIVGFIPWEAVIDVTSYFTPGFQYSQRYKMKQWDGRVKLFRQTQKTFPAGLVEDVKKAIEATGIKVEIEDKRVHPIIPVLEEGWQHKIDLEGVKFDYPYDYQPEIAKKMVDAKRGIINLATGSGKSELSCIVIAALRVPTLFLVPGKELLYQTAKRISKRLRLGENGCGMIGDSVWNENPWVTVASVPTIYQQLFEPRTRDLLDKIQLLFADECFVAGTKVDGRPIEQVQVGDMVWSWDDKSEKALLRKITKIYITKPRVLVRVTVRKGLSQIFIVCTPGHLFWTQRGWVPALALQEDDIMLNAVDNVWLNLLNVDIIHATSDGTFGGTCPDGKVYNLEVEDTHTYMVEDIVVHNCHHTGADSWYLVMRACNSFFKYGLSGTALHRSDGADLRLIGVTGPVIAEIRNKELIERGVSNKVDIRVLKINEPMLHPKTPYQDVYQCGIVENPYRNKLLCEKIEEMVNLKKSVVVLVKEIKHGEILDENLWKYCKFIQHKFINGQEPMEVRQKAMDEFQKGELPVIIASSILNEGVDMPNIDVMILADGGNSTIKTLQRIGRGIRKGGTSDTLIVYDTADFQHHYLTKHSLKRLEDYKNEDCFNIIMED